MDQKVPTIRKPNKNGFVKCPVIKGNKNSKKCIMCRDGRLFFYSNGIENEYPDEVECWYNVNKNW